MFHKNFFTHQGKLSQTMKFLTKDVFNKQRFLHSHESFLANRDQKDSLKSKILKPFNTKCYAKILLIL